MAKGLITHAYLEDTADAIRVLRGESDTYTPNEFGEKILDAIPDVEVTDSIVSVIDAAAYPAEGLEFAIEPVQDLHGYDKPWPAGGGKNLLNVTATTQTVNGVKYTVNNDGSVNIKRTSSNLSNSTIKISDVMITGECKLSCGVVPSWNGNGFIFMARNSSSVETQVSSLDGATLAAGIYEIYITTQYNKDPDLTIYPMIRLSSVADYTFEPYSNICPISGWTGANGGRTGKNLFDKAMTFLPGYYIPTSSNIFNSDYNGRSAFIPVQAGAQLVANKIKAISEGTEKTFFASWTFWNANKEFVSGVWNGTNYCTVPENAAYLVLSMTSKFDQTVIDSTLSDYILAYGNEIPSYEPYQGTSIPITFPTEAGTVYGGNVDVVNGKLTANYASVDLGTFSWTLSTSGFFYTTIQNAGLSNIDNMRCSVYKNGDVTSSSTEDKVCGFTAVGATQFRVRDSSYNNTTDFQAAMQGVQLVYELATPIEYDITPQQVQMLLGDNNIWCDTGDTTLEYKVDLSRYIAKRQAAQL